MTFRFDNGIKYNATSNGFKFSDVISEDSYVWLLCISDLTFKRLNKVTKQIVSISMSPDKISDTSRILVDSNFVYFSGCKSNAYYKYNRSMVLQQTVVYPGSTTTLGGITTDANNIWVCEYSLGNLLRFDKSGTFINAHTIIGGTATDAFNCCNDTNNIYVWRKGNLYTISKATNNDAVTPLVVGVSSTSITTDVSNDYVWGDVGQIEPLLIVYQKSTNTQSLQSSSNTYIGIDTSNLDPVYLWLAGVNNLSQYGVWRATKTSTPVFSSRISLPNCYRIIPSITSSPLTQDTTSVWVTGLDTDFDAAIWQVDKATMTASVPTKLSIGGSAYSHFISAIAADP